MLSVTRTLPPTAEAFMMTGSSLNIACTSKTCRSPLWFQTEASPSRRAFFIGSRSADQFQVNVNSRAESTCSPANLSTPPSMTPLEVIRRGCSPSIETSMTTVVGSLVPPGCFVSPGDPATATKVTASEPRTDEMIEFTFITLCLP